MSLYQDNEPDVAVSGLEILVRADDTEDVGASGNRGGTKGIRRRNGTDLASVPVRVEQLRESLEGTVAALRDVFGRIAETSGQFPLKEVQVSFEVSAKGGIRLIGTSEVEGKGGITLVFGARDHEAR
ncbi:Pepco domain-containing protein [Streptomyces anulatus]|uniref:Pepco domain-containing protein n=1 Tax=Streptomyces anulatus TaxID=1892 RepID=UPI00362832AB